MARMVGMTALETSCLSRVRNSSNTWLEVTSNLLLTQPKALNATNGYNVVLISNIHVN